MSNFFKIFFGSCLGVIVGLGLLVVLGVGMAASFAAAGEQRPEVKPNSILEIDLEMVPELTNNVPSSGGFEDFDLDPDAVLGVHDIVRAIDKAATDDNIKGIFFNSLYAAGGVTKLRQIRAAVEKFRATDKFVLSFAPSYDQTAYYLASAGSEVYLGPLGVLDMRGLAAERLFYKRMLDQLGVRMEVFWAGDFKSATEPFRRESMSPESKLQTREYVTALWEYIKEDVARSRNLRPEDIHAYANDMTGWKGEATVTAGLIDGIWRRSEVENRLRELVGFSADQKLNKIDLAEYFAARLRPRKGRKSEVAVLYAEGSISDGKGEVGTIGDKNYVEELRELTQDDDVKAVVLRVNSGGGSASASENIWYAAEELKAAGKPFVVSMGSVAASGGYYIAAGADSIFAEPTTITGSIGVFMMFPQANELMNDKIGLTTDTVNVTRNANAFSVFRDLGEEEKTLLRGRTEDIYERFLGRVAEGREMPLEEVRALAGGRVYAGDRALEIGLVDRIAGLEAAIASAATLAGVPAEEVSVGEYPRIKPPLERLLEELLGEDAIGNNFTETTLREQLGEQAYQHYRLWRESTQMRSPQARMTEVVAF